MWLCGWGFDLYSSFVREEQKNFHSTKFCFRKLRFWTILRSFRFTLLEVCWHASRCSSGCTHGQAAHFAVRSIAYLLCHCLSCSVAFEQLLLTKGTPHQVSVKSFRGYANLYSLHSMKSLMNKFTYKCICFYNSFNVGGLETKDNYVREAW